MRILRAIFICLFVLSQILCISTSYANNIDEFTNLWEIYGGEVSDPQKKQPASKIIRKSDKMTGSNDTSGPTIDIPESINTEDAIVNLSGQIKDTSAIIELSINKTIIPLKNDGRFTIKRGVPVGENIYNIIAIDEWGNFTEKKIKIIRDALKTDSASNLGTKLFNDINFGNYYGLIIGNNKYEHIPHLETAVKDAETVADVLINFYSFEVKLLENGTRKQIIEALDGFRKKLKANDNLLIYYAGHGWYDDRAERGYWLPVNARANSRANWISNADITDTLKAIFAKHIIVVADSCYSGTLTRSIKMMNQDHDVDYIQKMAQKSARVVLTSGGNEPVVDGGGQGHSIFAKAFIDALQENTGIMEGINLYSKIRQPVVSNSQQTPHYATIHMSGDQGGDFLFIRKNR
jgi:hypothetical protein